MKKDIFRVSGACAVMLAAQLVTSSAHAAVLSDDSVSSWGPWSSIATAAGGNAGTTLRLNLKFSTPNNFTDSGEFVTDVNVPDETIFYGAIGDKSRRPSKAQRGPFPKWLSRSDNFKDNNRLLASLDSTINLADSEDNEGTRFGTGSFTVTDQFGYSFESDELAFSEFDSPFGTWVEGRQPNFISKDKAFFLNTAITGLNVGIIKASHEEGRSMATFVGGTASSLNAIQAMGNNIIAHYNGVFLRSVNNSYVSLDVNLSNATWNGDFNSGKQGFGVYNGTITGSSLSATTATASFSPNVVAGSVNANFFGDNAEAIAGVVDVELSRFNGPPCGECAQPAQIPVEIPTKRFVDTFVTIKTGERPIGIDPT